MPNTPNSEFHKMLKQITESHNKEMSKIYSKPVLVTPIAFNIKLPKVDIPKIDFDFKSLDINSLLGDYFKEHSLSERMKKAVIDNIKNIDFDSFKLYSDNDENNNEEVVKYGEIKVSTYTDVSNTTYIELSPRKVSDDVVTDENELTNDETIKDYTQLIDFVYEWNKKVNFNFSHNPSMYMLAFNGVIPFSFLAFIHTLHLIIAWVLVETKNKHEIKLEQNEKE